MESKRNDCTASAKHLPNRTPVDIIKVEEIQPIVSAALGGGLRGAGGATVTPQAVVAPLQDDSLCPTGHLHLQLFDGQVIQIVSGSLPSPLVRGEGKGCDGDQERRMGREAQVGGAGTLTLLTSDNKTYILPHNIASEMGSTGGYIIAEEVLSTEEMLGSSGTILPPHLPLPSHPPGPPQIQKLSHLVSDQDPLAIATSEAFSEDYMSTEQGLGHGQTCFALKAEVEGKLANTGQVGAQPSQGQQQQYPTEVISLTAPVVTQTTGWGTEASKHFAAAPPAYLKLDVDHKMSAEVSGCTGVGAEGGELLVVAEEERVADIKGQGERTSTVYPGWCGLASAHDGGEDLLHGAANTASPSQTKETAGVIEECQLRETSESAIKFEAGSQNKEEKSVLNCSEGVRGGGARRSLRITRGKAAAAVLEPPASQRRRKGGVRGGGESALWVCGSCDAMFRTKASRDRHLQESHAFTCFMCGWHGETKTQYELHVSTQHCSQHARCLTCRKDFFSYQAYKEHMKEAHHSSLTAAAAAPQVKTELDGDLQAREVEEGPGGQGCGSGKEREEEVDDPHFQGGQAGGGGEEDGQSWQGERGCPYCGKIFTRRSRFLRHLNYHLGRRTFACGLCTKKFVEKSGLDSHLLTHRPLNASCPTCPKVFKTQRTLKRHLRTHLNKLYSCELCGKQFRHEESLRVHRSVHRAGGSGNMCGVCDKDCKTPYYLHIHIKTKHGVAKFVCRHCSKTFKWKQSYRKHLALQHDQTALKYPCSTCPRECLTRSELRLHQLVHNTERKYLCDVCGKAFKQEYVRDKHMKTVHQEECQYMCPQCGALFKAKAYLDQHMANVHTTKERIKCKQCGHDFKTEANLKSHIKVVHKPRSPKYSCSTCSKHFLSPKDLARHAKVHSGVKDFACPHCHRCFSRKDNLTTHLRTHAPTTPNHRPPPPPLPPSQTTSYVGLDSPGSVVVAASSIPTTSLTTTITSTTATSPLPTTTTAASLNPPLTTTTTIITTSLISPATTFCNTPLLPAAPLTPVSPLLLASVPSSSTLPQLVTYTGHSSSSMGQCGATAGLVLASPTPAPTPTMVLGPSSQVAGKQVCSLQEAEGSPTFSQQLPTLPSTTTTTLLPLSTTTFLPPPVPQGSTLLSLPQQEGSPVATVGCSSLHPSQVVLGPPSSTSPQPASPRYSQIGLEEIETTRPIMYKSL